MIIPSPRLIAVAAAVWAAALAASGWTVLAPLWAAAAFVVVTAVVIDAVRAWRAPPPRAARTVPPVLALGVAREVTVDIDSAGSRQLSLALHDFFPAAAEVRGLPVTATVPAGGRATLSYSLRPLERGQHRFGPVELRIRSPFGLWDVRRRVGAPSTVRVYPNFGEVARYALMAIDHRLSQLGVLQRRRRGEGLEFHQLRDYRNGDALRQIDWKASSRLHRLVSREYQDERNQQVIFLIDCGRRMSSHDGALSHFDHALNAVLLLAHVSLRQGDAVGLMTVAADPLRPPRWLPPRRSAAAFRALMEGVFDLQPSLAAPDFLTAVSDFLRRVSKRALVVVVTNLRDEDCADLRLALQLLRRRHLVMLASLRERAVRQLLLRPVRHLRDAVSHAAAADYLMLRRETFAQLTGAGAICLDVEPQQLPLQLVNRYLDVKRAGAL